MAALEVLAASPIAIACFSIVAGGLWVVCGDIVGVLEV